MSQHLQTQVRKVPLMAYVLVVLAIALLLSLALLRFSGMMLLGSSGVLDPNGVTFGSLINPDGLAGSCMIDPNGGCFHLVFGAGISPDGHAAHVAWGHGPYPGHGGDPDGGKNQLAMGPVIEPNG